MNHQDCKRNHCGRCCGRVDLRSLSDKEREVLQEFAQYSFLPVAPDRNGKPVYLEGSVLPTDAYTVVLSALRRRGFISIDYEIPLSNYDYELYGDFQHHGSMALTFLGQSILDQLEF